MLNKFEKELLNRVERKIDELGLDDRPFMSGRRKVMSIIGIIKEMQLNDDWLEGMEDIEGMKDMLKEMDEKGPSKELEKAFKLMIYRRTGVGDPIKEEENFSVEVVKPVEPTESVQFVKTVEKEELTKFEEFIVNAIVNVIVIALYIGLVFIAIKLASIPIGMLKDLALFLK